MSAALPSVTALVLAEALDALPARLRKKVDDAVTRAAGWPVTADGERVTVAVDDATTVTLVASGGVVRADADVRCSCLLAPNCLHRVAVLAIAPIDDSSSEIAAEPPADAGPQESSASTADAGPRDSGPSGGSGPRDSGPSGGAGLQEGSGPQTADEPAVAAGGQLTARQRAAADGLWRAGIAVLEAGITGSGVVLRTALLRAVHEARANGLHRAAATGTRVATGLQAAREAQPQHRLAELADDVRDLLAVSRRLRDPQLPSEAVASLLGTARRAYDPAAGLRLYGLCTVPFVAESGYAGTVTYLADRDSRLWMVANTFPGGADRAAVAGNATVALGEAGLSHRELTRAGLVVSGATASESGQLGAGRSVRAVRAGGTGWTQEPLARLWTEPLVDQVRRAFAALTLSVQDRPAGADLLFLTVRVLGGGAGQDGAVIAATADDTVLALTVAEDHAELAYRDNLRLLAQAEGVELLLIGRPDPARRATVHALAVGIAPSGNGLLLPDAWAGHVDLGYDRLHRSHLPADVGTGEVVGRADRPITGDPALHLLRRHLERVVAGGRAVQALAESQERRLRRARLDLGADLLAALTTTARVRPRDAFGRITGDDGHAFAQAWLAAAVYEEAASRALTEASWMP
jgi:hypothetical protein